MFREQIWNFESGSRQGGVEATGDPRNPLPPTWLHRTFRRGSGHMAGRPARGTFPEVPKMVRKENKKSEGEPTIFHLTPMCSDHKPTNRTFDQFPNSGKGSWVGRYGQARPGLSRPGLSRPGLSRPGLSKPNLACSGLAKTKIPLQN